jgi:hypothetical protein
VATDEYGIPELPADLTHTRDWHSSPDYHLQWLADHADRWGTGIALTLVVSGGLISGTVESRHAYLRGSAETIREFDDEGDENVEKLIELFATDMFEAPAQIAEDQQREAVEKLKDLKEGEDTTPSTVERIVMYRHIHLRDAYWIPGGAPAIPLGHTRVLLSQVSAWSVGRP